MPTHLSSKLCALGVALLLNGVIIGGVICMLLANTPQTTASAPANRAANLTVLLPTI